VRSRQEPHPGLAALCLLYEGYWRKRQAKRLAGGKTKMKKAAKETVYRISIAIWVSVVRADNPNFNQWSSGRCSAFGKKPLALTAGPT